MTKEKGSIDFSVAMSVYQKDQPRHFEKALDSVIEQTVPPGEIVIVLDGPVGKEITNIIRDRAYRHKDRMAIRVIYLKRNRGLGPALKAAVEHCRYEWIARMDSDDIARSTRFEIQMNYIMQNPETDVLGGQIAEFMDEDETILSYRRTPLTAEEIGNALKRRCPFNHMTVLMRKEAVLRAGNYRAWHFNEDYDLWIRMFLNGCRFANVDCVLVKARIGREMYRRRGGLAYFESEKRIQSMLLKDGVIGTRGYLENVLLRFAVQILLPDTLRGIVFRRFARTSRQPGQIWRTADRAVRNRNGKEANSPVSRSSYRESVVIEREYR